MARVYDFVLPVSITGVQDSVGISDLQSAGLWDQIPADLQAKMSAGDSWCSSGVEITQAELRELSLLIPKGGLAHTGGRLRKIFIDCSGEEGDFLARRNTRCELD